MRRRWLAVYFAIAVPLCAFLHFVATFAMFFEVVGHGFATLDHPESCSVLHDVMHGVFTLLMHPVWLLHDGLPNLTLWMANSALWGVAVAAYGAGVAGLMRVIVLSPKMSVHASERTSP